MISIAHLVTLLASCTFAANTNADFVGLKASLVQYIEQNPSRKVPILVRLSFHDLAGGLGPHGKLSRFARLVISVMSENTISAI